MLFADSRSAVDVVADWNNLIKCVVNAAYFRIAKKKKKEKKSNKYTHICSSLITLMSFTHAAHMLLAPATHYTIL